MLVSNVGFDSAFKFKLKIWIGQWNHESRLKQDYEVKMNTQKQITSFIQNEIFTELYPCDSNECIRAFGYLLLPF